MFLWKATREEVFEIMAQHLCRHLCRQPYELNDMYRSGIMSRADGVVSLGIIDNKKVADEMNAVVADGAEAVCEQAYSEMEDQLISAGIEILPGVKMSRPKLFTSLANLDEAEGL